MYSITVYVSQPVILCQFNKAAGDMAGDMTVSQTVFLLIMRRLRKCNIHLYVGECKIQTTSYLLYVLSIFSAVSLIAVVSFTTLYSCMRF